MSKVRSRSSWIGGGSHRRAPANTTSSARHISRANPNFRANHRRRILRRFISVGLPANPHRAVRADHAASVRDWPFLDAEDYRFFAAVKRRASWRAPRGASQNGVVGNNEVACLERSNDVFQQDRFVIVEGNKSAAGLRRNTEVVERADAAELPQVDLVQA